MQVIRQYAVPQNGQLIISVPPNFDGQEVEILVLTQEKTKPKRSKTKPKTTGLEKTRG